MSVRGLPVAGRLVLYALVPILTLAVEDDFLTEMLGYEPWGGQFPLARSGLTVSDVVGVVLVGVTLPLWLRRRSGLPWKGFVLLGAAVLVSGVWGLVRGAAHEYALFEPSVWKTLVPLFGLTAAFVCLFADARERRRFLAWFCIVQVVFAAWALGAYLFAGLGQPTYFDATVPIFAGDMLIFIIAAYGLCFFRMVARLDWRYAAGVAVLGMAILMSLRRNYFAALVSPPICSVAAAVVGRGGTLRPLWRVSAAVVIVGAAGWLFLSVVGPVRLPTDLVVGRLMSLNLAWAAEQSEAIFGTTGHTDDFLDGVDTVLASPLLGQGLAVWFPLPRTSTWQDANVHAGLLKVWIKLGLLGVAGYVLLLGQGLRLTREVTRRDERTAERLFVVWFALHFLLLSIYMNTILFGYKNSFVVAMYLGLAANLLAERRAAQNERSPVSLQPSAGDGATLNAEG